MAMRTSNDGPRRSEGAPRRGVSRKKVCIFDQDRSLTVDYKDPALLKRFLSENGKITPRRINGNSAQWQRRVAKAIKRARLLGLLPFKVVT
jgi:small subunit ribosomal protein S18